MKFLILIISFNNRETIFEAVESAILQKFENFEVLIVDSSNDLKLIEEIKISYNHIKLNFKLFDDNIGKSNNWNRAYEYALENFKFDYIINLHADDTLNLNLLSHINEVLIKFNMPSLICGAHQLVSFEGKYKGKYGNKIKWIARRKLGKLFFLLRNDVSVVGFAVDREILLNGLRFKEEYTQINDWIFFYEIIMNNKSIIHSNFIFGKYREQKKIINRTNETLYEIREWYNSEYKKSGFIFKIIIFLRLYYLKKVEMNQLNKLIIFIDFSVGIVVKIVMLISYKINFKNVKS